MNVAASPHPEGTYRRLFESATRQPSIIGTTTSLQSLSPRVSVRQTRCISQRRNGMSVQSGERSPSAPQNRRGMNRRDLLLSGSSLLAAAATLPPITLMTATSAVAQQAAPRPHIVYIVADDLGMERRWISRLRYQDAEHRQVGAGWSTARTVLRSADVHPVASGTDDWPLPMPLRPANSGHSDS